MTYTIVDDNLNPSAPIEQWEARIRRLEAELALDPKDEGVKFSLDYSRALVEQRTKLAARRQARAA